jgi:ABC-type transport system involved in multi-copper enzyme maturation permease subunit
VKFFVLVSNSVREAMRRRSLQVTLAASVIFVLGLGVWGQDWAAEHGATLQRFATWAGMRYIGFFGALLTCFVSMAAIPSDLEHGTAAFVLSKPVARYQFLLAKFVGVVLVIALNLLVVALVTFGVIYYYQRQLDFEVAGNLLRLGAALLSLASATLTLSTFLPAPMAGFLGLGIYGLGKWPGIVNILAQKAHGIAPVYWLLRGIHAILPNLGKLNYEAPLIKVSSSQIAQGAIGTFAFTIGMLILAMLIFGRKEL